MLLRYLLLTTAMVVAGPAMAQTAPRTSGAAISEIVVTAQKRSENIQDVPISITVVGGDQIARQGLTSVQDLSRSSASLEFISSSLSPGGGAFVRGIGTQGLGTATAASSVAVVVDGVSQGNVPIGTLLDIDRVEVLKGPQGTLFGSSVSAGVLNITTLKPDFNRVSGQVFTELAPKGLGGEYTRYVANGSINIPIGSNAAVRVAAQYILNDGLSQDTYNGQDMHDMTAGVRARLLWQPTDRLTINLIGDYTDNTVKNDESYLVRFAPAGSALARALALCGITASPENSSNCSDYNRLSRLHSGGASGQIGYDFGPVSLTSITSYRKSHTIAFSDVLNIAAPIARQTLGVLCPPGNAAGCLALASLHPGVQPDRPSDLSQDIFSQEVRLSSNGASVFQWTVGGYYQRVTYNFRFPSELAVVRAPSACAALGRPINAAGDCLLSTATRLTDTESTDYAAFANGTYNFSPTTRLNAGIRYTHSEVRETASADVTVPTPVFGTLSVPARAVTYRAALQHDFGPNTMVYGTVSTGYKAPQVNDQSPLALVAVRPEKPTSYEIGIKQTAFDGRLAINADAYYMSVDNFQTQSCIAGPAGVLCSQVNVPHVDTKGVEVDIFGRPWTGMTVNLSAIYNDAKYPTNFFGADATNLQGKQLNFAPKYKITASFEQRYPVSDSVSLVFAGDVAVRDEESMYLSANPIYTVPAATIWGGRIGAEFGGRYSIYAFGRNLGNKVYPTSLLSTVAYSPGAVRQILDQNSRRVVGVQLKAKF